jgi:hypothetical protein
MKCFPLADSPNRTSSLNRERTHSADVFAPLSIWYMKMIRGMAGGGESLKPVDPSIAYPRRRRMLAWQIALPRGLVLDVGAGSGRDAEESERGTGQI